jgi:hypothetical protein
MPKARAHAADHQRKADAGWPHQPKPCIIMSPKIGADMAEHVSGRGFDDEVGGRVAVCARPPC